MSLKVFFIFIPLYTINFAFGVLCEQALGYVIYLEIIAFLPCIPAICFDTCGSKEWKFIKEFKEKNTCKNIMEDLISKEPKITSHIKCWHKEKIYEGEYNYQYNQTDYKKSCTFQFTQWKDVSKKPEEIWNERKSKNGPVKLKIRRCIYFGNRDTKDQYLKFEDKMEKMYEKLIKRCKNDKKEHVDKWREDSVNGLQREILSDWDEKRSYWWINSKLYLACCALLMIWPYRWFFNRSVQTIDWRLEKVVYCDSDSLPYTFSTRL